MCLLVFEWCADISTSDLLTYSIFRSSFGYNTFFFLSKQLLVYLGSAFISMFTLIYSANNFIQIEPMTFVGACPFRVQTQQILCREKRSDSKGTATSVSTSSSLHTKSLFDLGLGERSFRTKIECVSNTSQYFSKVDYKQYLRTLK